MHGTLTARGAGAPTHTTQAPAHFTHTARDPQPLGRDARRRRPTFRTQRAVLRGRWPCAGALAAKPRAILRRPSFGRRAAREQPIAERKRAEAGKRAERRTGRRRPMAARSPGVPAAPTPDGRRQEPSRCRRRPLRGLSGTKIDRNCRPTNADWDATPI